MKRINFIRVVVCAITLFATTLFTACSLDSIKDDIADLQGRVQNLEEAVKLLRDAYSEGKIITSVTAVNGGFYIAFSDGSGITILNGADGDDGDDGVTPILKIDENGFWTVSYDGGNSFQQLTDSAGNPVSAKGEKGEQGADGSQGSQGEKGAAGICVRVVVDKDGFYAFELYSPDAPDVVIETVTTPYTSDTSGIIQSIVEDEESGVITITTADGTSFKFNLDVVYPTGIVVLTDIVNLEPNGTTKFEFRLNPSNARIGKADLQLDKLGSRATAESYVTVPENYRITNIEAATDGDGNVKAGQYVATVLELGKSSGSYFENAALVLTTKDGRGETVQISSQPFGIRLLEDMIKSLKVGNTEAVRDGDVFYAKIDYGTDITRLATKFETSPSDVSVEIEGGSGSLSAVNYSNPVTFVLTSNDGRVKRAVVVVHYSNLPVVYITTPNPIISKDEWTKKCSIQIWNADSNNDIYENVQIKGRGNSTWQYEKKPYAIKLDSKAKMLGMPKHKRWVLLANYLDNTAMRNDVSFKIAQSMSGMAWNPHGYHIDLVMNGEFLGSYYLCEQIKVDANRVNITEITPEDTDEYSKTGGFIFELDSYYDEMFKFRTKYFRNYYSPFYNPNAATGLPVQFKDPDEDIADAQFNYAVDYFNTIEEIIIGSNPYRRDVFDYIDMDSFIDWWLVQELAGNVEPMHPKSSYMYKDRGTKLFAGPVWDFDYDTYVYTGREVKSREGLIDKDFMWYHYLLQDSRFKARVKERWAMHKPLIQQIADQYIPAKTTEIAESVANNKKRWPGSGNFGNSDIKGALQFRINSMDAAIKAL